MSEQPLTYEPEVISIDTQSRRVFVYPDNYGTSKFEHTNLHFVGVANGEFFYLGVRDVQKLICALRDWGYLMP